MTETYRLLQSKIWLPGLVSSVTWKIGKSTNSREVYSWEDHLFLWSIFQQAMFDETGWLIQDGKLETPLRFQEGESSRNG